MVAFTWVIAAACSVPPLFGWSRYIPKGMQCSCSFDYYTQTSGINKDSYVINTFFCHFTIPLVISFCNGNLFCSIQDAAETTQRAEREVTNMVIMMVNSFLLCWVPYSSIAVYAFNHQGLTFGLLFMTVPAFLSKTQPCPTPISIF
jgi:rhodopsin